MSDANRLRTCPVEQKQSFVSGQNPIATPGPVGLTFRVAFNRKNFGQAHAPNGCACSHHLEPRGRPPAGPYHNTGVAREQKNFELVKLFNDIEGLGDVSTPLHDTLPHDIRRRPGLEGILDVILIQPL